MKTTKELRLEIDAVLNAFSVIKTSREVSLAFTNLQRAKMWLGKVLEAEGRQTPYPQGDNPASAVIEPQAEHTAKAVDIPLGMDQTGLVKFFRAEVQRVTDLYPLTLPDPATWNARYVQESLLSVQEAKMWLGMELHRIFTLTSAAK